MKAWLSLHTSSGAFAFLGTNLLAVLACHAFRRLPGVFSAFRDGQRRPWGT